MSTSTTEPSPWKPSYNPWLIGLAVTLAAFMEILDTTIVNVALPYIAGAMSSSNDQATYALTAYLVANGIVLTISGWLSDTIGRKRYFITCIAMFTLTSLACGLSQSLAQLVIFRCLQGFFGGGLQPNQQAIILDSFEPAKRGAAFGLAAIATVVAPVLGPSLGGWITDNSTWRWIFFVNIPVGALAVVLNGLVVEDPPWEKAKQKRKKRGIDYIGLGLISLGLGCLQVMIDRGEDADWFGSKFIVLMGLLSFLGIFGAICWLLTAKHPIVNLDIFKDRNFTLACILISAMALVLYGSGVIIPIFAEGTLGYNALLSGFVLSPGGVIVILLIPVVEIMSRFVLARYVVMIGFAAMAAACIYASGLVPAIDFKTLVTMNASITGSLAFLFVPISTIAYLTLPLRFRSDGAAIYSMFRNVFGAIGVSLSQAMVTERTQMDQAQLSKFMTPLHPGYATLNATSEQTLRALGRAPAGISDMAVSHTYSVYVTQAQVLAYSNVFAYGAVVAGLAIPVCLLISKATAAPGGPAPH